MGKKKHTGLSVPKKIFGFKLSKGTRKDIGKLLNLVEHPDAKALGVTLASVVLGAMAERTAEGKAPLDWSAAKPAAKPQSH